MSFATLVAERREHTFWNTRNWEWHAANSSPMILAGTGAPCLKGDLLRK